MPFPATPLTRARSTVKSHVTLVAIEGRLRSTSIVQLWFECTGFCLFFRLLLKLLLFPLVQLLLALSRLLVDSLADPSSFTYRLLNSLFDFDVHLLRL